MGLFRSKTGSEVLPFLTYGINSENHTIAYAYDYIKDRFLNPSKEYFMITHYNYYGYGYECIFIEVPENTYYNIYSYEYLHTLDAVNFPIPPNNAPEVSFIFSGNGHIPPRLSLNYKLMETVATLANWISYKSSGYVYAWGYYDSQIGDNYVYTPVEPEKLHFNDTIPITYNYIPINYITGKNKTLKLSMIKALNTNHGESVTDGQTTDIQRFTDATNMRVFCSDMVENDEKVLGYTSANNYVTVTKGYVDGNGAYTVTFKYYINGVYQSALDHTARVTSDSIPSEPIWTPYYSLLLDLEHSACRPSRIYLNEQTNTVRYNDSENDQNVITDANQSLWFSWLGSGYHTDTTDPYDYGGDSTPDSGDGQWDNSSETIDIPSIPTVSISDTGFVSVFNPTLSQVKALADYMWAGAFDVSLFKKVMANPMDSIIGFALIPCEPTVSGVDTVKVGNIDTGVSMNAVSNQFVDVDCGTLNLEEYWGNYLDYAPYTKITLVLPFIGSVHLSPDDCMKKTIGIKYRIDILSGGCVAYVTCNGSVLYQFTGSCSAQLPITNLDYRGMISALISIGTTAVGVGSAIASGGITAPMVAVGVGNTATNVMNGKPNIQHGGSLGSTSGFLGTRIPYLIITRPRQCVPTGINKFKGLPSLITSKLKNVTGFTQVHDIHLDELPCSDAEKTELRSILERGVIV